MQVDEEGIIEPANLTTCNIWFLPLWLFTTHLNDVFVKSHITCSFVSFSIFGNVIYSFTNLALSSQPITNDRLKKQ